MPYAIDHRRYPRLTVDLPIFRRAGREYVEERVVNLSYRGLALATRTLLRPGSLVELFLNSHDGGLEIPLHGKVVYARTLSDATPYLAGVKLGPLEAGVAAAYEQLLLRTVRERDGRRIQARAEVYSEGLWHTAGDPSPPRSVTLVNVSFGGALLVGPAAPRQGDRGELTLVSPLDGRMASLEAVVSWSRSSETEDLAGIRFDHPEESEPQRFIADALRGYLFSPRRVPGTAGKSPGIRIGDFELGALLGQGGRCDVYRGRGLAGPFAGREVALKHLRPELAARPGVVDGFLLEADLGRMLALPGMAAVHSGLSVGDEHWMVMEPVDGAPLGELLAGHAQAAQRPPAEAVVSIAIEVLRTLDGLHRARTASGKPLEVVHGSLGPAKVLVSQAGEVTLLGSRGGRVPRPGSAEEGRLPYLPPELASGGEESGPQVDVYQSAVLLYEALTGVAPFQGETPGELVDAIRRGPVPPSRLAPGLPPELDRAVVEGLQRLPAKRPPGARAFAERLEASGAQAADPRDARSRFYRAGAPAARAPQPPAPAR